MHAIQIPVKQIGCFIDPFDRLFLLKNERILCNLNYLM